MPRPLATFLRLRVAGGVCGIQSFDPSINQSVNQPGGSDSWTALVLPSRAAAACFAIRVPSPLQIVLPFHPSKTFNPPGPRHRSRSRSPARS
ncbi:hypothetical protein B0T19DRAFT_59326 [Cercophora scortea]|uniref:Uncharacterized protein n=1 Tax=Cercophora scortea TaxID=314031 RepID=A0AAE0MMZ1_9PEZI|nr:hypothetical protein B0T19DRAFT_59326 [Cercophora scortea]